MDTAVLAAIASPRRQEILRLVWEKERSAGEIRAAMTDVTFGAVSLQLRVLAHAGLLQARTEGRHRFYRARREALGDAGAMLERMWDDALWRLKLAAELEHSRRGPRPRARRRIRSARARHGTLVAQRIRSARARHGTLVAQRIRSARARHGTLVAQRKPARRRREK